MPPYLDLDNIFTYHAPSAVQAERYERLRAKAKEYAALIVELTPPSPEQTDVQRASMMANAAIAIHGVE